MGGRKILGFFKGNRALCPADCLAHAVSLARALAQMTARLEDLEKQIANKK